MSTIIVVFRHTRRGCQISLQVVGITMWLLGFELWTFGRAVGCSYPLSHLTSPTPPFFFLKEGSSV